MLLILQVAPMDPGSYLGMGIFGVLAFVIVVLGGLFFRLVTQQSVTQKERDALLMDFVNRHRAESTASMEKLDAGLRASSEKLAETLTVAMARFGASFDRQSRSLDEVLLTQRVLEQIDKLKRAGSPLDDGDFERAVRTVLHERSGRSGNG